MSFINTNSVPPASIPFHVAKAYGVQAPSRVGRVSAVQATEPASAVSGPANKLPSAAQKLVGATVPGRVDFSEALPRQVSGGGGGAATYSMYASAGAKNAAATGVMVGRSLDVRG